MIPTLRIVSCVSRRTHRATVLRLRRAHYATGPTVTEPPRRGVSASIILQPHPHDPGPSTQPQASSPPPPPPPSSTNQATASSPDPPPPPPPSSPEAADDPNSTPPVPVLPRLDPNEGADMSSMPSPHSQPVGTGNSSNPPFDTYRFFAELEKTFATPTARSLMRATRALLVDRIERVRREGLTVKDLESVRVFCFMSGHLLIFGFVTSKHTCSRRHCQSCGQS